MCLFCSISIYKNVFTPKFLLKLSIILLHKIVSYGRNIMKCNIITRLCHDKTHFHYGESTVINMFLLFTSLLRFFCPEKSRDDKIVIQIYCRSENVNLNTTYMIKMHFWGYSVWIEIVIFRIIIFEIQSNIFLKINKFSKLHRNQKRSILLNFLYRNWLELKKNHINFGENGQNTTSITHIKKTSKLTKMNLTLINIF